MAYEKHDMKVMLFSEEDAVFTTEYDNLSGDDNTTGGDAFDDNKDSESSGGFIFSDD